MVNREPKDPAADAMPTKDEVLLEWKALRDRDYGCEGIAMVVGIETVEAAPPRKGDADLAARFRMLAIDLAPVGADPAGVLELIAARRLRGPA